MNICFYTSAQPSVASLLNISYLIHSRPGHNYSFLNVRADEQKITLIEKLRKLYGETRYNDGRFDFQRDNIAIKQSLQQHLQPIRPADFRSELANAVNDTQSEQLLGQLQPDVIIQAGAGILKDNIFSKAAIATINVHHGVAPEIRGVESTFWCMFYGVPEKIGVTCHMIDAGLDTGAVILRRELNTTARTYVDIQVANYLMGRDVLVNSIDILEKGNLKTMNKGQVKSYYFGVPDNFLYYALKKRDFHPLMKISQKVFTMKDLNVIE